MLNLTRSLPSAQFLAEFLCPPECLLCDEAIRTSKVLICDSCRNQLVSDYHRCRRCATPIPPVLPDHDCIRCRKENWKFDEVLTLGPYRKELRDTVIRMKKPIHELLRRSIASLLADLVVTHAKRRMAAENQPGATSVGEPSSGPSQTLIVPVPNHWTHSFSGAADSAGSVARHLGRELGVPVSTNTVVRIRKTGKQGMLSWTERSTNVRNAFQISRRARLVGAHIYLVDDVLTSGATCAEISRVLKKAGASRISVLVAARGTGSKESRGTATDEPWEDAARADDEVAVTEAAVAASTESS
ncbi:MAG: ComF family protein [Pirellulaceae bacterium]